MDPIVLSYHDVALRKSDVMLLDDGNWLNDKIIGFMFEYYNHEVFTNCDGKIAFIDPDVVQLMRYLPKEDAKAILSSLNLEDKELILFPINDNSDFGPGGTHWSLLVFDKYTRKFRHFDSSRGSNSVPATQVHRCLLSLDFAGELVEENAVQQTNGNDCGLHVIKTAEILCHSWLNQKEGLDMSKIQENAYRGERKRIRKLILDKL